MARCDPFDLEPGLLATTRTANRSRSSISRAATMPEIRRRHNSLVRTLRRRTLGLHLGCGPVEQRHANGNTPQTSRIPAVRTRLAMKSGASRSHTACAAGSAAPQAARSGVLRIGSSRLSGSPERLPTPSNDSDAAHGRCHDTHCSSSNRTLVRTLIERYFEHCQTLIAHSTDRTPVRPAAFPKRLFWLLAPTTESRRSP